jgi:hypothetical protein
MNRAIRRPYVRRTRRGSANPHCCFSSL